MKNAKKAVNEKVEEKNIIVEMQEKEQEEEKLLREVALNEKIFTYNIETSEFDLVIKVKSPTLQQKEMSEALYAKKYNQLLMDDEQLTTDQLLTIGKKRGQWTSEDEQRLMQVDQDIQDKKDAVRSETNEKKKEKLQLAVANAREEKFRLAIKLGKVTSTSIENLAERSRYEYMIINCISVMDTNGKDTRLYETIDELNVEQDLNKLERILLDARSYWTGEGIADFLHLDD